MRFLAFLIAFAVSAVLDLLYAWWVMVLLGIAHGFDSRVPDFGYWTTFFVIWTLGAILSAHDVGRELGEAVSE